MFIPCERRQLVAHRWTFCVPVDSSGGGGAGGDLCRAIGGLQRA
ncbi:hypothetical protein [Exiguobacterium profundum]|nr:hypothetical protein [Exiguobacterium profundum]